MRNGLARVAVVLLFGLGALGFFLLCSHPLVKLGAGDEPHYLVVADALAHFDGPEVSRAYRTGAVARAVLPPGDLDYTAEAARAVSGTFGPFHGYGAAHGIFSVHSLGLPLLLAPVVAFGGGMVAAKALMLVLALSMPLYGWRVAETFFASVGQRLAAGLALSLVALFTVAASQIYPDLLGGVVLGNAALSIAGWRLGLIKRETRLGPLLVLVSLAALPWLHLRLAMPALLCVAAFFVLIRPKRREGLIWAVLPALSILGVACYNHYAFGHWGGPYGDSDVEVSATAAMVLFGLQLDQFQGIFLHAPILLSALLGLGVLARKDWRLALFLAVLYGALVGPNSIHPNWYGGGSFGGRFVLAGGLTLLVPAGYGLSCLFPARPRMAFAACGLHLAAEAFIWSRYLVSDLDLYTPAFVRALGDYSSAWAPFQPWLPAFYRLDLAIRHWPNLGWLAALALLFAAGLTWRREGRWGDGFLALAGICVIAGGIAGAAETPMASMPRPAPQAVAEFDFSQPGAEAVLGRGWSTRENWGVWGVGRRYDLLLPVASEAGDLDLSIDSMAFLPLPSMRVTVPVLVNGTELTRWVFEPTANGGVRTVRIPAALAGRGDVLIVSFRPEGTVPPSAVPGLMETRRLGMGIAHATLRVAGK